MVGPADGWMGGWMDHARIDGWTHSLARLLRLAQEDQPDDEEDERRLRNHVAGRVLQPLSCFQEGGETWRVDMDAH